MARIFFSGFEYGNTNKVELTTFGGIAQASIVRSGGFAGQITSLSSGSAKNFGSTFVSSVGNGPFFLRVYFLYTALPTIDDTIMEFQGGGNNRFYVALTSTGALKLFAPIGTQIGSTSSTLTSSQWYRLEMKYDNTGGAGAGVAELLIDGSVVATKSTVTYAGTVNSFIVGGNGRSEANTAGTWYFDDIAVNDSTGSFQTSYPGAGKIINQFPAGAGDSAQWTIAGSAAAATNWQGVSENPPDDAVTINKDKTLNNADMFAVTPSGIGVSDIVSVVGVNVRSANDVLDATAAYQLQIEKTSGGTKANSSNLVLARTTYSLNNAASNTATAPITLYQDPDGAAWTQATLDTMQIGYKTTVAHTNFNLITSVWALVEYTPAVNTGYPAGLFGGTQFAYSSFSNAYGSIGSTTLQDTAELALLGVG